VTAGANAGDGRRRGRDRGGWLTSGHRPERLRRSQLGVVDIAASTMANIAPAMSFYFGFGFLALTAGIASPLTIVVAAVAMAFLGSTLAQFARAHPSTGSFITFIGKAFGPTSAIATSIVLIAGYVVAIVAVIAMSGGFTAIFLNHYLPSVRLSLWPVFVIGCVVLGAYLMVRGIHISTRLAGVFFSFEMFVLVLVSVLALIQHRGHLTLHPFEPQYLAHGFKGLALGFPLAVYMFIGWENSATLAEETDEPRRNVPRAIFTSIAIMAGGYLLFAYATVEGFRENVTALSQAPIAFMTLANGALGVLAFFAYLAGVTSTVGCVIAAVNSQSRLLFSAGREGLLPAWLGRVYLRRGTPVNALLTFIGLGFALVFAWGYGLRVNPVTLFAEASTLGTVMIVVVYFVANLALPVYYRRFRPEEFSGWKHIVVPLIGAAAIAVPIYELFRPGIAAPYDWFPYVTMAVIALATVYAVWLNAHDATLAERVGSLVADEPLDGKFALSLDEDDEEPLQRRLRRVLSTLAGGGELRAVLVEALSLVCDTLSMDSAAVFTAEPDGFAHLLAAHGEVGHRASCPPLSLNEPALVDIAAGPRVAEVADSWPVPEALLAVACRHHASIVVAPALDGSAGTLLVLSRRSRDSLKAEQVEFIASVSQVVALAVKSQALADDAERSAAVLQTAYAVARAITQSLDLEQTHHEIAVNAARVVAGSRCVLFEIERDSGDLVAVAASDPERERLLHRRVRLQGVGSEVLSGEVLPGSIVREVMAEGTGGTLSVNKFSLGGRADAGLAGTFNTEASLVVPLVAQRQLVGSLLVYAARRRRGYSDAEVAELRAVGEQAAISINNALLYRDLEASQARVETLLGRLTRMRDEERQSLARVVHDDVVQSIVGAVYRLESVREDVPASGAAEFDEAMGVLRQSVDDARRVIWGLRPPALEGLGLRQALHSLADRAEGQGPARISVSIADVSDLSLGATTGLYMIAREALLNSVHHAAAARIQMTLTEVDSAGHRAARLQIDDDGVGFDDTRPSGENDHFGTMMMAEQATLIGGTFSIDSLPGRGTRVDVVVPLGIGRAAHE
jgi:amino acid transporter/signal transduction histidine kinase